MEQIAKEWDDYFDWCENNNFKWYDGQVLRAYVKTLQEGK